MKNIEPGSVFFLFASTYVFFLDLFQQNREKNIFFFKVNNLCYFYTYIYEHMFKR